MPASRSSGIHEFEVYLPPKNLRKRMFYRKNNTEKPIKDKQQYTNNSSGKNDYKENFNNTSGHDNEKEDKDTQFSNKNKLDYKENSPELPIKEIRSNDHDATQKNKHFSENKTEKQLDESNEEDTSNVKESAEEQKKNANNVPREYLKELKVSKKDPVQHSNYAGEKEQDQNKKKTEQPSRPATTQSAEDRSLTTEEPQSIKFALLLLWASLFIDVVKILMSSSAKNTSFFMLLAASNIITGIILILNGFLLLQIAENKNWARWIFSAISFIELVPILPSVFIAPSQMPVSSFFTIAIIILRVYGVFLLFTKPGSQWFGGNEKRKNFA